MNLTSIRSTTATRYDLAGPLNRSDIVLALYPFTDMSEDKVRPALVLAPLFGQDTILAFISSRAELARPLTDVLLDRQNPEFPASGLRTSSIIRLNKLITLHRSRLRRYLGRIGPITDAAVMQALRRIFQL